MSSIYVLHRDPKINAGMHSDQHILGHVLYYATLLVSAHQVHNTGELTFSETWYRWELNGQRVYEPLDSEDEMVQWVAATQANYRWARRMLVALLAEYQKRWGDAKGKRHKTWEVAEVLREVPRLLRARSVYTPHLMTPFVTRVQQVELPPHLRGEDVDVVDVHRYLYAKAWGPTATYRMGACPDFMVVADFDPVPDFDCEKQSPTLARLAGLPCPTKLYAPMCYVKSKAIADWDVEEAFGEDIPF